MKNRILLINLLLLSISLIAQSNELSIPDGEKIRYKTMRGRRGEEVEYSNQSIFRINENGKDLYLVKSNSDDGRSVSKFTVDGLIPISTSKQIFGDRSDISTTTTLSRVPRIEPHEIPILDMEDMAHALRAYPFENPRDMELFFLGEGGEEMEDMSFNIYFEGAETIEIGNREYAAWKLEMKADLSGAMAIFSAMIPKTYMWFSQEPSRHLLKMEGSEGPGASNEITYEMISYSP